MTHHPSRDQKAAKAAKKASLFVANQYSNQKQQQSETSQDTEEKSDPKTSETLQEKPNQKRHKALQLGKKASLFAAKEYLRRNHQQPSEEKKPTLLETFLEIIKVGVYAIAAIALTILLLTLRFGFR
ncbi:MAG: hypothetical protein ACLFTJ_12670 [Halothece sp.]